MSKKQKLIQECVSVVVGLTIILQFFIPGLFLLTNPTSAFAQEVTPTATVEEATPTPNPTDIVIPTSTDTPTPTPEVTENPSPTVTPEITATPEAIPTDSPMPTELPTTEPTLTPTDTPIPTIIVEPTAQSETPTLTETPTPFLSDSVWTTNSDSITTTNPVVLNVPYVLPQNKNVSVTFTKLPDNAGKLTIKEITLTPEQMTDAGALSDKAYDISSDMADGTFAYTLSLPIPQNNSQVNQNAEIRYAENLDSLSSAQTISEQKQIATDSVTVSDVNHFTIFVVTDHTPTAPLSSPSSPAQPRYISGFGLDNNYTIFYEDRNDTLGCSFGSRIYFNQTTSGPSGLSATGTITNICEAHFTVKDWPITISGTTYAYRAWGAGQDDGNHNFYVSNDLTNWTLVTTFTFDHPSDGILYGFHDIR